MEPSAAAVRCGLCGAGSRFTFGCWRLLAAPARAAASSSTQQRPAAPSRPPCPPSPAQAPVCFALRLAERPEHRAQSTGIEHRAYRRATLTTALHRPWPPVDTIGLTQAPRTLNPACLPSQAVRLPIHDPAGPLLAALLAPPPIRPSALADGSAPQATRPPVLFPAYHRLPPPAKPQTTVQGCRCQPDTLPRRRRRPFAAIAVVVPDPGSRSRRSFASPVEILRPPERAVSTLYRCSGPSYFAIARNGPTCPQLAVTHRDSARCADCAPWYNRHRKTVCHGIVLVIGSSELRIAKRHPWTSLMLIQLMCLCIGSVIGLLAIHGNCRGRRRRSMAAIALSDTFPHGHLYS